MTQQRRDHRLEIIFVYLIDFRCNFEWHSDLLRNFNRAVHSFLWRNSSQKSQITSWFGMESVDVARQTVIDRCLPVYPRQWLSLAIRDRDHLHLAKLLVQRNQIGNIQPAM